VIRHEKGIEFAAFQGLDAVHQMLQAEICLGRGVRVAPPGSVDADGAHKGAKMHVLHGDALLSSPAIRASLPDGKRLDGFRHIMHAQYRRTPRGTLLATTFTSLAYETYLADAKAKSWDPARIERWQSVQRATTAAERKALLGTWMLRSTDGGLHWSAPYRVPLNSPHGPVALRDGRLLYAGKRLWDAKAEIGVCESTDDGLTWRWLAEIPSRPGDSAINYHELHAVEAADGRLIAHIRNHNKPNDRETLQSESTDGGKTWSAPRPIGVWGLPSHLLRLADGRLVMTYGYRRDPRGNHARVSRDHGQTWSEPIVISNDGKGDIGYPSTVEVAPGKLLTLWYESKRSGSVTATLPEPPFSELRLAKWSL
jgi:hypothetical protein